MGALARKRVGRRKVEKGMGRGMHYLRGVTFIRCT